MTEDRATEGRAENRAAKDRSVEDRASDHPVVAGPPTDDPGTAGGAAPRRQLPALALVPAVGLIVLLAVLSVFPLVFTNATVTNFGVITLIFVTVASAWNFFSGFSGYLSLGHAVFYGTGAYFLVVAARDWHMTGSAVFLLLPLAGLAAAVIAVPFGLVGLRVRRHTFVVITIAFFFIAQLSASNLSVTGGSSGLLPPVPNWAAATFNNPFYYVAFLLAVLAVALSFVIRRSRFGLQLRAIRDDEDRAAGLGVRAMPVKLTALVLSAFVTGMAGGLWVYFIAEAFPQFVFDPLFDLSVVLMAFFGGLGTIAGPVLGALILEPAQMWLNLQAANTYESQILFGALFLVVILFLPRGVLPTAGEYLTAGRAKLTRRRERERGAPAPSTLRTPAGGGSG